MSVRVCDFADCGKKHFGHGYCVGHLRQHYAGKTLAPLQSRPIRTAERIMARDEQGRKLCTGCEDWLPEELFNRVTKNRDGLNSRCRTCIARNKYAARYGLSPEDFDTLERSQGGRCGICRRDQATGRGSWHIDHDHSCCPHSYGTCGQCVRGLLCAQCNHLLGNAKDDPEILANAIAYLTRNGVAA